MIVIAIVVIDDPVLAATSQLFLNEVKQELAGMFDMTFSELKTLIGLYITRTPAGIKVDQKSYVNGLLERHGLENANGTLTPLPKNAKVLLAGPHKTLLN